MLRRTERMVRRWQADEHRYWRERQMPASTRWYSMRSCWPDALTMLQRYPA
jgi:hypothetical protein